MLGTRHEEYGQEDALPFILHPHLFRTPLLLSGEQNWHEDMEIQLCLDGEGEVTVAGQHYPFHPGDVVAIGADVLHYTGTDNRLTYACLIVRASFCRQMRIPYRRTFSVPVMQSASLREAFMRVLAEEKREDAPLRVARLSMAVLSLLCLLFEECADEPQDTEGEARAHKKVKAAIEYVKNHYGERITLDEIARQLCTDKYALCRDFKRMTGDTLFGYLNRYRCHRAAERILSGETVGEAARACGFDNPSFFSRTYKRYMGALPSEVKRENCKEAEEPRHP